MAKKRKASASSKPAPAPVRTRFARNETFDDSEDEFAAGRDHILLDEAPEAKRRRRVEEDERIFQESDEGINGYISPSEDEEEEEEEDYGDGGYDENGTRDAASRPKKTAGRDAATLSDDDLDEGRRRGAGAGDDEDEYSGWGSSKRDYYNADVIETEADALAEEEEAKKLQKKHLQALKEDDFGLDEDDWLMAGKTETTAESGPTTSAQPTTEIAVNLEISEDMDVAQRRSILHQRYPELAPLTKELLDLQPLHEQLTMAAKQASAAASATPAATPPIILLKLRALTAYLAAISAYFFLLTSPARKGEKKTALSPAELREHPVMEVLLHTKAQWEELRQLEDEEESEEEEETLAEEEAEEEEEEEATPEPAEQTPPSQPKKTKIDRAIDKARAKAEKERQKKLQETEAGLTALSQQLKRQKLKAKTAATPSAAAAAAAHGADASDSDFGDETHIEAHVLAEEAAKRRSLRFYTSQIDQKANKRHAAGREAGGDEDLPYRERLKDRQARLLAQAEKRGREAPDVLGGASDEEDDRVARELRSDAAALGGGGGRGGGGRGGGGRGRGGDTSDSDDYYDMVAARTHAKKAEKRQRAEAYADALKQSRHVEVQEEIGPDGKRAITYAIQKNKGLTPHRKKDVRNPRVKKRKDYAKKQKKLGSIRQVYKGGEGRGGYGGELTGIKTNVVKSVKL